jgi:flagellar basal body P-ring protein FlgI
LVGDVARAWGLQSAKVEGIALVTNLRGTGSDPPPSDRRDLLVNEMKRRGVERPNQVLASANTSLVLIQAILPPGVKKGDAVDVDVMVPSRSETTSLRNGWVMQTALLEMAVLGNQIRAGHELALAEGPIVVDALVNGESGGVSETRGRILGGGRAKTDRSIGLVIREENHSVTLSRMIGDAVNRRFHTFDRGIKKGAATPKRDDFIELEIQPQYRNNLLRYLRVIESLSINESDSKKMARLNRLRDELLEPETSVQAALQLEAIGHEASATLVEGIRAPDPLVRFYAAESLAYLNHEAAIESLARAAETEPALRHRALTALGAMTNLSAHDALSSLMRVDSAETQYGAFRALLDANPRDPMVRGESLGDVLKLHHVNTDTSRLVHIRRTERPEIVLFGGDFRFTAPFAISAGSDILIKSQGNQAKVTRFALGQDSVERVCSLDLAEIARSIVEVGGAYMDVVAAIVQAKEQSCLDSRVRFDALPQTGREFKRDETTLTQAQSPAVQSPPESL